MVEQLRRVILDDDLTHLFGLEYGAHRIETCEGLLTKGLLQTEEYLTAVISAGPKLSAVAVKHRWEIRRRRQQRLAGDNRLRSTALTAQATIVQQSGEPSVLRHQLEHLAPLVKDLAYSLKVRILLFEATAMRMVGASRVCLLHFVRKHLPVMAWREPVTPVEPTADGEEVETLRVNYDQTIRLSSLPWGFAVTASGESRPTRQDKESQQHGHLPDHLPSCRHRRHQSCST